MRILLALSSLLLPAQAAVDGCLDDNGRDRCSAVEQSKARALFGLEPIEAYTARRDELHRVLYVDGYGRDLIAVSAIRPRGEAPILASTSLTTIGG